MAHRVSEEAQAELDSIWYYVAKESGSVDIAQNLIESITARFYLLATHPYIGRSRDEELAPGFRTFPVGNYVIIYCVDGEDVLILHIAPPGRDLKKLLKL